ncbi:MAG: hypothetical protein AB1689_25900 [Thermodesulfobacteriota bacterium]
MDDAVKLARAVDACGERLERAIAQLARTLEGCVTVLGTRLTAIENAVARLAEIQEARLEPDDRASLKLTNLRSSVASLKTMVEQSQSFAPRK